MYILTRGNIQVRVYNEFDKDNYIKAGWKLLTDEVKKEEPKVEEPVETVVEEVVEEKKPLTNFKKSKYVRK